MIEFVATKNKYTIFYYKIPVSFGSPHVYSFILFSESFPCARHKRRMVGCSIAPLILSLGARGRLVVDVPIRPLYVGVSPAVAKLGEPY